MIIFNKLKSLNNLFVKLTYSLVVATIITTILFFLPKNDSAEVSLTIKLKTNILMLEYINALRTKKLTIEEFLTSESSEADKIILGSEEIIKNCKLEKVNGEYLIGANLRKFTLDYNMLTKRDVNLENCANSIITELNYITRSWISRLLFSLNYVQKKQKSKYDALKENEYNSKNEEVVSLLLNALQNMTKSERESNLQADIDILKNYYEQNDYYELINPSLQFKKNNNLPIQFLSIFLILFILLNIRLIINFLKKY